MKIQWLGHAAFLVTTQDGTRILMDPYQSGAYDGGIGYDPIQVDAHIVTVSHDQHEDHNCTDSVRGDPVVIKGAGKEVVKGVQIERIHTFHDNSGGRERGDNHVVCLSVDGLRVCHMGDLGHLLTDEQVAAIGQPDVMLIPIGGTFTLDPSEATAVMSQLNPRILIPMHFKTAKCGFPIATVDEFLEGKPNVTRAGESVLDVQAGSLPEPTDIVVLEHAL